MQFIFLFFTFIFCQSLNTNQNFYGRVVDEFKSIESKNISNNLFIWPTKESKSTHYYNLLKNENNNILFSPIIGIRYSQVGFEMNSDNPYSIL